MKKLLISNLVFGEVYPEVFVGEHLRSLLDMSNIPKHANRLGYMIYTDQETHAWLKEQKAFRDLRALIPVKVEYMVWPAHRNPADMKYESLVSMLKASIKYGLDRDCYLSTIVADLVFAQGFFDKVFQHLDAGHDSVFMHPLRSAYESMRRPENLGRYEYAAPAHELCQLGYANLHPLWVACHWRAPQFSKIPDTLLWNSGTGLMARTFSITPIAFTPYESMRGMRQVIDIGVPPLCKNPYWCHDWTDAPVIGVEPLKAWYAPFENHGSSIEYMRTKHISEERFKFGNQILFYPDQPTVSIDQEQLAESNKVINALNGVNAT